MTTSTFLLFLQDSRLTELPVCLFFLSDVSGHYPFPRIKLLIALSIIFSFSPMLSIGNTNRFWVFLFGCWLGFFFFAVPEIINTIKIESWGYSGKQDQTCKCSTWPVLQGWTRSILLKNCGSSCHSVISEQLLSCCLKQFVSRVSSYFNKQGLWQERKRVEEGEPKYSKLVLTTLIFCTLL